jgi:hypothetical protein
VSSALQKVLAPGESLAVDVPIEAHDPFRPTTQPSTPYNYPQYRPSGGLTGTLSYVAAGNLATHRAECIDRLMEEHDDLACIYGEFDNVQPDLKLAEPGAIQKHWRMLRALVPLESK